MTAPEPLSRFHSSDQHGVLSAGYGTDTWSTLDWDRDGQNWPHRQASRFVEAGGIRWHVQIMGQGPVMLLLHGTGAASHSWRDIMPLLAAQFTVVVPDLPGHGFTRAPGPDYSVTYGLVSLEDVAGKTRVMPDEYIDSEGNGVTDAFRDAEDILAGDWLWKAGWYE